MSDSAASWIKPVIVLVPGAWNTPGSFNLLLPYLNAAGYTVRPVSLPSVGADPPLSDIQPDVDAIKAVIHKELEIAQDILVVMHDYGAIPGGEAVKGQDKATRLRAGLSGGVTCLFYAASPLLPTGSCLADIIGGRDDDDDHHPWILVSRNHKVAILEKPADTFCPEVEPELAKEYVESLRPHSYQTFFSRTTWEPHREIPFFCLFCKLDKVVPVEKQRSMAAASGLKFKSSVINTGHCPFLACPEDMAKAIRRAAKESTYYSGVIARDYGLQTAPLSQSR